MPCTNLPVLEDITHCSLKIRPSTGEDTQGGGAALALVLLQMLVFKAQALNLESSHGWRLQKGREMSLPSWCPHRPLPALQ